MQLTETLTTTSTGNPCALQTPGLLDIRTPIFTICTSGYSEFQLQINLALIQLQIIFKPSSAEYSTYDFLIEMILSAYTFDSTYDHQVNTQTSIDSACRGDSRSCICVYENEAFRSAHDHGACVSNRMRSLECVATKVKTLQLFWGSKQFKLRSNRPVNSTLNDTQSILKLTKALWTRATHNPRALHTPGWTVIRTPNFTICN